MKPGSLFLCYSLVIGLFSFNFLTEAFPFLDPEMGISLALLIALLLGNAMAFVAFCATLTQKKMSVALAILLAVLVLNIGFAVFAKTSFVVGTDRAADVMNFDLSYAGFFVYLFNGFLTLIFMPAAFRFRFFIPTTILYHGLLIFALSPGYVLLVLVMIWSLITGENIYLG